MDDDFLGDCSSIEIAYSKYFIGVDLSLLYLNIHVNEVDDEEDGDLSSSSLSNWINSLSLLMISFFLDSF